MTTHYHAHLKRLAEIEEQRHKEAMKRLDQLQKEAALKRERLLKRLERGLSPVAGKRRADQAARDERQRADREIMGPMGYRYSSGVWVRR